ncbi:MAG: preprotein translocase subunit YajC [Pseudomonadota bacterium]|nr:preprotein translocase subunit YajC [Pseudomonadota bacterium]
MFATPAYAQSAGAAANSGAAGIVAFAPFILIIAAFYFLIIRPQQRRAKVQATTIGAVKRGDSVITAGGIAGKVTKVEDVFVEVEIASGIKVRVVKVTLAEVTPLGSKPAND